MTEHGTPAQIQDLARVAANTEGFGRSCGGGVFGRSRRGLHSGETAAAIAKPVGNGDAEGRGVVEDLVGSVLEKARGDLGRLLGGDERG